MHLEILIDGMSYVVAQEHDATTKDLKNFAKRCAKGDFAVVDIETVQGAFLVLGQESLKRAVYVIRTGV